MTLPPPLYPTTARTVPSRNVGDLYATPCIQFLHVMFHCNELHAQLTDENTVRSVCTDCELRPWKVFQPVVQDMV
jgi:hypothetical protein